MNERMDVCINESMQRQRDEHERRTRLRHPVETDGREGRWTKQLTNLLQLHMMQ